MIAVSEIYSH